MNLAGFGGTRVTIDLKPLVVPAVPTSLDIIPPGFTERPLAGGGMVVFEEKSLATIMLHFGLEGVPEAAQRIVELARTRACGMHTLGIDDLSCDRHEYIIVYISRPPRNAQTINVNGELVFGTFDLACKQLDPWPKPTRLDFDLAGAPNIIVGDGQFLYYPAAAGYFLSVVGYIEDSGAGGGQTRIQLSQEATDFLATPGDFAAGGVGVGAAMTNQVLAAVTNFVAGKPLELDVDTVPGAANSNSMRVTAWVMMYEPYRSA